MRWFPGGISGKESACNTGDWDLIPELGRSPGGGHANPPQYSCLEKPMDRAAWPATVHRVAQSQSRLKWLSSSSNNIHIMEYFTLTNKIKEDSLCTDTENFPKYWKSKIYNCVQYFLCVCLYINIIAWICLKYFWKDCCCFCSVVQSCPTFCDPMDCSTPGFPVCHHLPEFAQTGRICTRK